MKPRFIASTALSAAFAFVLSIGTVAAPAFASTPRPDIIPTTPVVIDPSAASPETSTLTFQPDVRVTYLGKTNGSGGKVTYRFRVQNIGAATASNVGLGTTVAMHMVGANVVSSQQGSAGTIATLGQDQSREIGVTCTPIANHYCTGAGLTAYVTNDLNPGNNAAGSN